MKKFAYTEIKAEKVENQCKNLTVRWLITKQTGAENFAMRLFEMNAGGHTPFHSHQWEHEVFILEGEGLVVGGKEEKSFKAGDVIFVPANEMHQFKSNNENPVKFLCLIPYKQKDSSNS
ncbi:MAG: cupin domain-containing protein [Candidatus Bathyarchaeota archaeon]|nr:cupin domain-containing protein [Candidatus Bathyarchaeum tardum]WGM88758.1 MAG: cupin domain-containing protein [Candidatus Bathyarchaeum tardum]WNZ28988.1 MAG: cupin domain-containing protein [Candidatus Bathyarchaeota archaeon]